MWKEVIRLAPPIGTDDREEGRTESLMDVLPLVPVTTLLPGK